ncbi:transposase [Holospora curviuscula]
MYVITYNTAFHKSKKTKESIKLERCKLIFLPPYSPNFNSIERR